METGGLISIASLALVGAVVGVRLLAVSIQTRQLPELVIGLAMLCTACLGQPISAAGQLATSAGAPYGETLYALGLILSVVGVACLFVFIWLVFHPDALWAQGLVAAAIMSLSLLTLGLLDASDSANTLEEVLPRTRPWACGIVATVAIAFAWSGSAALHYHGTLRRSLALGFADPVTTNRFMLWAVSGYLGVALCASLEYAVLLGAAPLLDPVPLALTGAIVVVAGTSFYLAYSPPDLYVRWIRARADRSMGLSVI